eukprot:365824-Chlamydomonas_euryale.AAC.8
MSRLNWLAKSAGCIPYRAQVHKQRRQAAGRVESRQKALGERFRKCEQRAIVGGRAGGRRGVSLHKRMPAEQAAEHADHDLKDVDLRGKRRVACCFVVFALYCVFVSRTLLGPLQGMPAEQATKHADHGLKDVDLRGK